MSLAKEHQLLTNPPPTAIITSDEFLSDEPQLETTLHLQQIIILLTCLEWLWQERHDFFATGNISIYYEKSQIKGQPDRAKGPDFFVVLDTEPGERNSWVVWEEDNRFPNLIVEILSKKTAKVDRTEKKTLYQDKFQTPEYFWFHPKTLEFEGFRLVKGKYEPIALNPRGWRWSEQLGLYLGVYERQVRYFTEDGEIVPIPTKQLTVEIQQRKLAQQQAQLAQQQAQLAQQQAESERQQRELAQQQAESERQQRELAQQQAESERQQRELAQQQAESERQQRELAQQQAESERQERELAQQQAESERQERELAQQQLADMEALLARYRESLGEFSDEE
ncbi:MAG: Uma2 family endonuclease [Symploca sp. SIO2G7]|nr:Uma2 family endonuclease [Symploca sp. SIO2G7]